VQNPEEISHQFGASLIRLVDDQISDILTKLQNVESESGTSYSCLSKLRIPFLNHILD